MTGFVRRFSVTERAFHWVNAVFFLTLLGTGLVLYLPSLEVAIGRRALVKEIHLWTGISWPIALLLVAIAGDTRGLARTLRQVEGFDTDDLRWLSGRRPAPQGRFNAGQKVNAVVTASTTVLFVVSGLLLWLGERDTRFRFASTVVLHDGLLFTAVALLVGHLFLALIYPTTRHALRGMVVGTVREDWATRHHAKWKPQ